MGQSSLILEVESCERQCVQKKPRIYALFPCQKGSKIQMMEICFQKTNHHREPAIVSWQNQRTILLTFAREVVSCLLLMNIAEDDDGGRRAFADLHQVRNARGFPQKYVQFCLFYNGGGILGEKRPLVDEIWRKRTTMSVWYQ